MKLSVSSFALFIAVAIISCCSCKKSGSNPDNINSANDSITTALISGSWVVSALTQKKEDNTAKFVGYVFTFSSNGKLTAKLNGAATQGSWNHTPAITYYGSSSKEAMAINLGADNLFRRLSKTWNITSHSSSSIKMDNPEILEDEHLQLQKQ